MSPDSVRASRRRVAFSEWALSNPAGWAYLAPILIENNGRGLFITTARGRNHAHGMLDCSFEAAILGAYWGKEMLLAEQSGRITDVPVNTDVPVHTAWDIGVDDAMAIWCFQVYPDHLDIVDYYEGHGQGFDHYCTWLDERGYHGTD